MDKQVVIGKIVIFSCQQRIDKVLGDVSELYWGPTHLAKLCYQFLIAAENLQGHLQFDRPQGLY